MAKRLFPTHTTQSIEHTIDEYFLAAIDRVDKASTSYRRLWQDLHSLIKSGGKRFRPSMVMLAYELFGGKEPDIIVPIATAHELLHFSLLIHDDIIDRDYVRHGTLNIAGRSKLTYQKYLTDEAEVTHFSHGAALLAGDLMLSAAYDLIARSEASHQQKSTAHLLLSQSIFDVAGGELLDMEASIMPAQPGSALEIAYYKTACYSFINPLLTGAKLANATPVQEKALRGYAKSLGIAYQLVDDLLGVFGTEKDTGKSTSSDIQEGKRTFLVEQAMLHMDKRDKEQFEQVFGNQNASIRDINQAKLALEKCGAKAKTEGMIDQYTQQALANIELVDLSPRVSATLVELARVVTKRAY